MIPTADCVRAATCTSGGANRAPAHAVVRGGVGLVAPRLDAELAQALGAAVHALTGAGDGHVVAVLGELLREFVADAGGAAGDEGER
jgi:hypothetical protein